MGVNVGTVILWRKYLYMKTSMFLCFHVNFNTKAQKHACFHVNFAYFYFTSTYMYNIMVKGLLVSTPPPPHPPPNPINLPGLIDILYTGYIPHWFQAQHRSSNAGLRLPSCGAVMPVPPTRRPSVGRRSSVSWRPSSTGQQALQPPTPVC